VETPLEALEVERRFADWLNGIVSPLNDEQVQKMLRCEHGGISETLADLYADTKNEKYLRISEDILSEAILDSLKEEKDVLPGKHCNTNIPKLIGLSRIYELTGDTSDRKAAEFFWNTVVRHHSYVTGGNGNEEYFGPEDKLRNRLGEGTTETCNVYNMLKLSEHLFEWDASARVADFYEELSLITSFLLRIRNQEMSPTIFHLTWAGIKIFRIRSLLPAVSVLDGKPLKVWQNIYYHNDNELFIFQFIAQNLTGRKKKLW